MKNPNFEHLFKPIVINGMELKNRIALAPMGSLLAYDGGTPSQRLIDHYMARVEGGCGLIMLEDTTVHHSLALCFGEIGVGAIYDDSLIPGWKKLMDQIHKAGAKASIQLWHPGRQAPALGPERPPWAPSMLPCPCPNCQDLPHVMSIADIDEIIDCFAQAARRVKEAGVDAIELCGTHGYLIAQFMSAYSNRRTDKYGGDLRSRMRFALEIIEACRSKVGPDFPIIFRFSADERVPGGRTIEESVAIAPWLVRSGVDCLSVSTGVYANVETYTAAPMSVPKGFLMHDTEEIKRAVNVPVIAVGRLNDPLIAEQFVAQGKADIVAIGRQMLADPEWANKVKSGDIEDIRWCTSCSHECLHALMTKFSFKCQVNPELGRDREMAIKSAATRKRVAVVGGGPAGMEAARVAKLRGHDVTLFEREAELGGQYRLAAIPPTKQELLPYIKYQMRQLDKAGVKIKLSTVATTAEIEKLKPDAVIIATGSTPLVPQIPGVDGKNVFDARDVLKFKAVTGKKVLVAGGGMVGCETADLLASYGRKVTIVEMLPEIASDMVPGPRYHLLKRLDEQKVNIVTSCSIERFTADGAVVKHDGAQETIRGIDTIVLALGAVADNSLAKQIEGKIKELYVIGDAEKPGDATEAIAAGAKAGRSV
jgi:2,4-dienoyl-CoA reductase-like NADH-dependent reductase (Old Yellow Enzyme family)/pyruvate/2-oxoglutarate dehydrogenase complex dihydrolipoamide dehydrogenase (E3) component